MVASTELLLCVAEGHVGLSKAKQMEGVNDGQAASGIGFTTLLRTLERLSCPLERDLKHVKPPLRSQTNGIEY
jgi:hypothetical protein